MNDKMKSMFGKKKAGLSENEKKAKMGVVKDMQKMASEAMGDKLHGLKKVSVAASDKKGLAEGLDKAKELLDMKASESGEHGLSEAGDDAESAMSEMEEGSPEEEASESHEEAMSEGDECNTPEEIDAKIAELMAKKRQMEHK